MLVTRLTCFSPGFRSRTFSSAIGLVSPGTMPGQTSRTRGLSAAAATVAQPTVPASITPRRNHFMAENSYLLLLHDPDVAELQRVAVSLQLHRAAASFRVAAAAAGRTGNLHVVVDEDAVMLGGDAGVLRLLVAVVARAVGEV